MARDGRYLTGQTDVDGKCRLSCSQAEFLGGVDKDVRGRLARPYP